MQVLKMDLLFITILPWAEKELFFILLDLIRLGVKSDYYQIKVELKIYSCFLTEVLFSALAVASIKQEVQNLVQGV